MPAPIMFEIIDTLMSVGSDAGDIVAPSYQSRLPMTPYCHEKTITRITIVKAIEGKIT